VTFRKPLPRQLPSAFSVADAYANGFTRSQMRNRALVTPFRGTRITAGVSLTLELACRAIASRMPQGSTFSHRTAALLHGMPLPLFSPTLLDVTVPTPMRSPRRHGVRGHSAVLHSGDILNLAGVPVTTLERTWCDLGVVLELPDLVAVADSLLWHESPRSTRLRLATAIETYHSRAGRAVLRRALALTSDHSRSRPGSLVRVDLTLSDLPAPVANLEVYLPIARKTVYLDLAYPDYKLELEYHGDHHRSDVKQWRTDVRRGNDIGDEGWQSLQFTGDDLPALPDLRQRVGRRLSLLGWNGQPSQ
jgi:hypothetical protein